MWKRGFNKIMNKKQISFKQRFGLTILLLVLYRLCSHIPLPFVNKDYVQAMIDSNGSLGILNTLTGGNLGNMSIVALGITPYITASIVLQLMGVLIPSLSDMQKDGSTGQDKFNRITIGLAAVLGFVQSLLMMIGYGKQGVLSVYTWYSVLISTVIMTLSVFGLSFVGQYISDHLFGNGISLLLVTGILCSYLSDGQTLYHAITYGRKTIYLQVIACFVAILVILLLFSFTIWLNSCEKRVHVNYSQKLGFGYMKQKNVIPFKLIGSGVVPVIFASTILTIPAYIQMFTKTDVRWLHVFNTSHWLSKTEWWANFGILLYFLMIIGFSYYYQSLNLNEHEIADNLKRAGGSIVGVRPGRDTELYLRKNMKYLTFLGSIGLCVIAFVPIVLSVVLGVPNLSFVGTSIIIVVSVIDETYLDYKTEKIGISYKSVKHVHKRKAVSRL